MHYFSLLTAFIFTVILVIMTGYYTPAVRDLDPAGGAAAAGMQSGDTILSVDGRKVHIYQDLTYIMIDIGEKPTEVIVRHTDGTKETLTVTPQYSEEDGRYLLGITVGAENLGWKDAIAKDGLAAVPGLIGSTFREAFWEMLGNIRLVVRSFVQLITGQLGTGQVMGPIGIVQVMDDTYTQAAAISFRALIVTILSLTAVLSINLGVMNLFPIPALDGSHLVFLLIEAIFHKPVNKKVENIIYLVGFVLLFTVMALVAYQDIRRIVG